MRLAGIRIRDTFHTFAYFNWFFFHFCFFCLATQSHRIWRQIYTFLKYKCFTYIHITYSICTYVCMYKLHIDGSACISGNCVANLCLIWHLHFVWVQHHFLLLKIAYLCTFLYSPPPSPSPSPSPSSVIIIVILIVAVLAAAAAYRAYNKHLRHVNAPTLIFVCFQVTATMVMATMVSPTSFRHP